MLTKKSKQIWGSRLLIFLLLCSFPSSTNADDDANQKAKKQLGDIPESRMRADIIGVDIGLTEWKSTRKSQRATRAKGGIRGNSVPGKKEMRNWQSLKTRKPEESSFGETGVPKEIDKGTKKQRRQLKKNTRFKSSTRGRRLRGHSVLTSENEKVETSAQLHRHRATAVRGVRSGRTESTQIGRKHSSGKKKGFLSNLPGWAIGAGIGAGGLIGAAVGAGGLAGILCATGTICGNTTQNAATSTTTTSGVLKFIIAASREPTLTEINGIVEQIMLFYSSELEAAFPHNFQSIETTETDSNSVLLGGTTTSLVSYGAALRFSDEATREAAAHGGTNTGAVEERKKGHKKEYTDRSLPTSELIEQVMESADLNVFLTRYLPDANPKGSVFHSTTVVTSDTTITQAPTTSAPTGSPRTQPPTALPPSTEAPSSSDLSEHFDFNDSFDDEEHFKFGDEEVEDYQFPESGGGSR